MKAFTTKYIQLIILLIIIPFISIAQSGSTGIKKKQYPFLSLNYHYGGIIPNNDFVRGVNMFGEPMTRYQSVSLKLGWQNPGYTEWQRIYKGPTYGIGFLVGDLFNPVELGYPMALYGFFGIPVLRIKKLTFFTEFQFGFAWNWQHYDEIENPNNIAVGSDLTLYVDVGLNAFYPITKNLDLGLGVSFTHYSNGGFERPNRGLNLYAPSIELRYHINGRADVRNIEKVPKGLKKGHDMYIMLGYGDYQITEHEFDTNYYALGGLGVYYRIQHTNAFRSAFGVDFNYLFGLTALPDGTPGPQGWDNVTVGFIYMPELVIDRLTLTGGIGIYAKHHQYGDFKQTYQRLGASFRITENISAGINVRAVDFMLAEFLEFTVGYRIRWKK